MENTNLIVIKSQSQPGTPSPSPYKFQYPHSLLMFLDPVLKFFRYIHSLFFRKKYYMGIDYADSKDKGVGVFVAVKKPRFGSLDKFTIYYPRE
jgi:hypothetical protein